MITRQELASKIDHTLLRADAVPEEYEALCREAAEFKFATVCVPPEHVSHCKSLLKGSGVGVCTVVGFPLGYSKTEAKALETRIAIDDGADEIDMVINIGHLRAGMTGEVKRDIEAVVEAAQGHVVKVIIETCYLTDNEKKEACNLCCQAGAHFVKTSTGFGPKGATPQDVALMCEAAKGLRIKAAGGIRTLEDALTMIEAGADRIGASKSIEIVNSL